MGRLSYTSFGNTKGSFSNRQELLSHNFDDFDWLNTGSSTSQWCWLFSPYRWSVLNVVSFWVGAKPTNVLACFVLESEECALKRWCPCASLCSQRDLCRLLPDAVFPRHSPDLGRDVGYGVRLTIARIGLQLQPTTGNPFFIAGWFNLLGLIYTGHSVNWIVHHVNEKSQLWLF